MKANNTSTEQNSLLHNLLIKAELMPKKKEMIGQFTQGRTTSALEMTGREANALIEHLRLCAVQVGLRRSVFEYMYQCDMIVPGNPENLPFINNYLLNRGVVKKTLDKLNLRELMKVSAQFEALSNHIMEMNAEIAVEELLQELGIRVAQEETDSF